MSFDESNILLWPWTMFYALGLKTTDTVMALTIQLTSHILGIFADPIFKLKMWEQFLEMIN